MVESMLHVRTLQLARAALDEELRASRRAEPPAPRKEPPTWRGGGGRALRRLGARFEPAPAPSV